MPYLDQHACFVAVVPYSFLQLLYIFFSIFPFSSIKPECMNFQHYQFQRLKSQLPGNYIFYLRFNPLGQQFNLGALKLMPVLRWWYECPFFLSLPNLFTSVILSFLFSLLVLTSFYSLSRLQTFDVPLPLILVGDWCIPCIYCHNCMGWNKHNLFSSKGSLVQERDLQRLELLLNTALMFYGMQII